MSELHDPNELESTPWPANYSNYFTEVEEHFRRARGTSLFLLSPLDWALIENWRSSGVPLEAVLRGIDEAFDKWRSRKIRTRHVNSVAYCTQAIMEQAKRLGGAGATKARNAAETIQVSELREYLSRAAAALGSAQRETYRDLSASLQTVVEQIEVHARDLEDLERRLTALEEKMVAIARASVPDEVLLRIRRELDGELAPYRGKMTADQIVMLERRYLDTKLMELENLPRLSLFHMH
jgi:hypothetical protein